MMNYHLQAEQLKEYYEKVLQPLDRKDDNGCSDEIVAFVVDEEIEKILANFSLAHFEFTIVTSGSGETKSFRLRDILSLLLFKIFILKNYVRRGEILFWQNVHRLLIVYGRFTKGRLIWG